MGKGKDITTMLNVKIFSYAYLEKPIVLVFNLFIFSNQLSDVKSKPAQFIGRVSAKTPLKWVSYYSYHSASSNPIGKRRLNLQSRNRRHGFHLNCN